MRYRLNYTILGKPDLVFPKQKVAVFVNGCFWHQHRGCRLSYKPKTNIDFWEKKLRRNIERDREVKNELLNMNWKVIRVWECEIEEDIDKIFYKILKRLKELDSKD